MPKSQPKSSTTRRKQLADFVNSSGDIMVKACSTCVKHGRVCKVHVRSGKCSACRRRGQHCNLQVTHSEWTRLRTEKERLRSALREVADEQANAREALSAAYMKGMRLRREMDLLDEEASEAIAVEERNIEELEAIERQEAAETMEFPTRITF